MNIRNMALNAPRSRPTSVGLALLNAAVKKADSKSCDLAVTIYRTISKDNPKRPFASGYNVPIVDRLI